MIILLTGGAANGKSVFAGQLALRFPGPHYYLSAAQPDDADSEQERLRHGSPAGFEPMERFTDLAGVQLPARGTVLLECLCNLLDNEMFGENGICRDAVDKIVHGIDMLAAQCAALLIVTNEIGCDHQDYPESILHYMDALGRLNGMAAARADVVLEIVAGIPLLCKGTMELPAPPAGDTDLTLILGGTSSGKRAFAYSLGFTEDEILCDLEQYMTNRPIEDDPLQLLQKRVVTCRETGSGIIPDSPEGRLDRAAIGRASILLAQHAKTVIRMTCGIPTIIKS